MNSNSRESLLADAHPVEVVIVAGLTVAAIVAGAGWLVAETAAIISGHHLDLTLADAIHAVSRWHRYVHDPRRAFPSPARKQLPGPMVMYVAVGLVVTAFGVVAALAARLIDRTARGRRGGYATAGEIKRALSPRAARSRGYATSRGHEGRATVALGTDVHSRQRLFGAAEDSYLYLGPPRSGKGVHLIIPQTIDAPGAALVTATRPDTLRHTLHLRQSHGPVAVFDPQHLAGPVPRLRWAPHAGCVDPLVAIARARALAAGAQLSPASVTDAAFWQGMTEAVLRCYLHAAALDGRSMRDVLTWTARPADPTPVRILRTHPSAAPGWVEELVAQAAADPRQRDSVWAGVRRAVDSLADPRVLDACSPPEGEALDLADFLAERGTLYL
ncbi:MAG TPA: hypothetical protein VHC43_09740, partial [Mycobacteriales bacterium]|nr:hypothetical protein [Mycobacteriales bacterium]